jgi:hypothetical protein
LALKIPINNPPRNIIFLDVDGVLNHELFFRARFEKLKRQNKIPMYKVVKKHLRKLVKSKEIGTLDFYKRQFDPERIQWLNSLCEETNSVVVLSASMRSRWTPLQLNRIFQHAGATFTIIDKTGHSESRIRGVEIHEWLKTNCPYWFGVNYYDFHRYAIIDDDSDMLLWQQDHFFQTDNYAGLTPNICYKIKRYFTHKAF